MTNADPVSKPASRFRRALGIYAVMAGLILLAGPFDLFLTHWWQRQGPTELASLAGAASTGVLLGLLLGRDIWRLTVRRDPLWKDLLAVAAAIVAFAVLILVREAGIWLWPFAAGDALALSMLATMAVVTALTERRKKVRVYAFARHFAYVHADDAAGDAMGGRT